MIIDLSKFTSGRMRKQYSEPWSAGDYSYATDGYMVIRVPRIDGMPETKDAKQRTEQIDDWLTNSVSSWFNVLPVKPVKLQKCDVCSGAGAVKYCPGCLGAGRRPIRNGHVDEWPTCQDCGGIGVVPAVKNDNPDEECEDCNGTGEVLPDYTEKNTTIYGEGRFSNLLLAKLSGFSNVMIGPRDAYDFALLKFDEGMGLIMPMRYRYEQTAGSGRKIKRRRLASFHAR